MADRLKILFNICADILIQSIQFASTCGHQALYPFMLSMTSYESSEILKDTMCLPDFSCVFLSLFFRRYR